MIYVFDVSTHLSYLRSVMFDYIGAASMCNNYHPVIHNIIEHYLYSESQAAYDKIVYMVEDYSVPSQVALEAVDAIYTNLSSLLREFMENNMAPGEIYDLHIDPAGSLFIKAQAITTVSRPDTIYMPDDNKDLRTPYFDDIANDFIPERLR